MPREIASRTVAPRRRRSRARSTSPRRPGRRAARGSPAGPRPPRRPAPAPRAGTARARAPGRAPGDGAPGCSPAELSQIGRFLAGGLHRWVRTAAIDQRGASVVQPKIPLAGPLSTGLDRCAPRPNAGAARALGTMRVHSPAKPFTKGDQMTADATPTVFIVDNDAPLRESLSFLLESADIASEEFDTAEAFLETFAADRPGCLILDVRLPGMSGADAAARSCATAASPAADHRHHRLSPTSAPRCACSSGAPSTSSRSRSPTRSSARARAAGDRLRRRAPPRPRPRVRRSRARLDLPDRARARGVRGGRARQGQQGRGVEFGISEKTVEAHRARVMQKLGAASLAELVRIDLRPPADQDFAGVLRLASLDRRCAQRPGRLSVRRAALVLTATSPSRTSSASEPTAELLHQPGAVRSRPSSG